MGWIVTDLSGNAIEEEMIVEKTPITDEELFELAYGHPYNPKYPDPIHRYLVGYRGLADKLIEKGRQMERERIIALIQGFTANAAAQRYKDDLLLYVFGQALKEGKDV